MSLNVDFHSHVLPGVDDGSPDVQTSLEMLRMEAQQGIRHVVATPHFYAHRDKPEAFLARRSAAEQSLRAAMAGQADLPELLLGAEVHYYPGMSNSESLRALSMGQGTYILIEMPFSPWNSAMYQELQAVRTRLGLTPILAHIERYLSPFQHRQVFRALEELPVLIQANAAFFLRRGTAHFALRLLKEGKIQLLGSDCHGVDYRPPNLGEAIARISGHFIADGEVLRRLEQCQQRILQQGTKAG